MFSYLRPNRRSPSNPPSPLPDQTHSWEGPLHPNADHGHPQRYPDLAPPDRAPPAPPMQELQLQAPFLPPIERVTDTGYGTSLESAGGDLGLGTFEWEAKTQVELPEANNTVETYTFQTRPRIPTTEVQRPESAGSVAPTRFANIQEVRPRTGINNEYTSKPKLSEPIPQYPSSSDVQRKPVAMGRRPAGARMKTPPPGSLDGPAHPLVSTFEPAPQKSGKTLNLLNPMSLFARRRTSQAVSHYNAEAVAARKAKNNDQLEFQIKGTVVHDFSAPRSRKTASSTDLRSQEASSRRPTPHQRSPDKQEGSPDESRWSAGDRTPVFTEDFEEEQYPAAGPHVRKASDLSDLTLPKLPYAQGSQKPVDQGPKKNTLYQVQSAARSSYRIPEPDVPPPVLPKSTSQSTPRRISIDPASTPPKKSPSSKGRSRNVSEASAKDFTAAGLPKHMKSTSSRFSFDMIGAAEQERLLEDRHRQKSLEKKASKTDALDDEDDDDFDYDDMDEDDGLEERIPGVNADLEEDDYGEDLAYIEEEIPGVNADPVEEEPVLEDRDNLAALSFQQNMLTPLTPPTPGTATTPRDADGEVIGFAVSKNSPHPTTDSTAVSQSSTDAASSQPSTVPDSTHAQPQPIEADYHQNNATGQMSSIDDDDLYFDDGMIDEIGQGDATVDFDESVFDNVDTDEYGRPLKPYSALPTLYAPPMLSQDRSPSIPRIPEDEELNDESAKTNQNATFISQPTALAPHASVIGNNPLLGAPGLTQDSLAAYQSALAAAAFTAAANGKFHRDGSHENSPSEPDDSHPGLVTDSTHNSQYEPFSPSYGDDFDYDDALEDDAIIEAANKEALAYDTDGFYGQEFGFYSAPAAGEAEYTNGGYFGPPGGDGVNRSQSGRIVREPNLTPITERSEYSNRNSFMSLSHHGPSSLPGPGLAQLASLMGQSDYEGDLTLGALMKLRRGAWGGSQASLHSSTGSPRSAADDSSPVGHNPSWPQGPGGNLSAGGVHRNANGANSFMSEGHSGIDQDDESEFDSSPGSPTITMAIRAENTDEKPNRSPEKGSPTENAGMRRHKHSNSADSISYLKEDDPHSPTGERWILERRRTSETGEELLNREVVSGGRI